MLNRRTASAACLALLASACATTPSPVTITDTVLRTPGLSTLSRLVADAGLADTLRGAGPYTLFAPTDDAFKAVPAQTMQQLAADKEMLRGVLLYHTLPGAVTTGDLKPGPAKTLQGASVALARAGSYVTVEDALVTTPDLKAANGAVHVIDRVLLPPRR